MLIYQCVAYVKNALTSFTQACICICMEDFITSKEVARILKVTVHTLERWRRDACPDLKPVKIGKRMVRYRKSVVEAFLSEGSPHHG